MKRWLAPLLCLLMTLCALVSAQTVVRRPIVVSSGGDLSDGLVSFWKLEEGNFSDKTDSVGTNHLTDVSGVSPVTGKIGNASEFQSASSDRLTIADNASLSFTSSVTFAGWVRFTTLPGAGNYPAFIAKWNAQAGYTVFTDGDVSRIKFSVSSDGTASTEVVASNFGAPSTATWYFVYAYFDDAANEIGISINDGTVNTATFSSNIFDNADSFEMGRLAGTYYLDGDMDAWGIWSRKLSPTEVTCLYNAGSGQETTFAACP